MILINLDDGKHLMQSNIEELMICNIWELIAILINWNYNLYTLKHNYIFIKMGNSS